MQNTTNYNLKKPEVTDYVQISDLNENFEIIDAELKRNADEIDSLKSGTQLYTLNDAWIAWQNGEKFPIAFLGDSTTDGYGTTNWTGNENVVGTDHQHAYSYPKLLENLIREYTSNNTARVYNAGFSGKTATWGYSNIESIFGTSYADVKMIGISFGINDRLVSNTKVYHDNFEQSIENIVKWCFSEGIQPFLLTTQAIVEPYTTLPNYPLRDSVSVNSVANKIKFKIAKKYNLELIDINKATEEFLKSYEKSLTEIIGDFLHFGDVGHQFVADFLFANIYPNTFFVEDDTIIDYTSQNIKSTIDKNKLFFTTSLLHRYYPDRKVFMLYNASKSNTIDTTLIDVVVFTTKNYLKLFHLATEKYNSTQENRGYVKLNDSIVHTANERTTYWSEPFYFKRQEIGTLKLGLNKIKSQSGTSTILNSDGFEITSGIPDKHYASCSYINGKLIKRYPYIHNTQVKEKSKILISCKTNVNSARYVLIPLADRSAQTISMTVKDAKLQLFVTSKRRQATDGTILDIDELSNFSVQATHEFTSGTAVEYLNKNPLLVIFDLDTITIKNAETQETLLTYTVTNELGAFNTCNYVSVGNSTFAEGDYIHLECTKL